MISTSLLGIAFILLGLALLVAPVLGRYIAPEDIPSWLLYVYRRGNFYFVTSPILILLSVLLFLIHAFRFV